MGENKWTKEQLDAITAKNCNLLVAAAAGSGKTAVLVERIIRKITDDTDPVDIDSLLVVTFTNASATEMRERIAEAISKALDISPSSKILQRQLTLLNKASITTIHSFCLEVIRNNFQTIDLDPNFRIADETESLLLKTEALDDLFEDIYENEAENEEFFKLLECYGGNRDDQKLQEIVSNLYEFVQSHPWPKKWLDDRSEAFNLSLEADLAESQWGRVLINSLSLELIGLIEMMKKAIAAIKYSEGLTPYLSTFQEELAFLEDVLGICGKPCENKWDSIFNSLNSIEFGRLPSCKKVEDKEKQEYVKSIRDNVKNSIKSYREEIFIQDSTETISDLKYLHPLFKYLSSLVMEFDQRYSEKKRKKLLLDFNDLEHFCLEILSVRKDNGEIFPSSVACALKDRFEEILVDEYQDSNLVQEIMLSLISRIDKESPNIFMVGDVKQSIYRFRQAKPELFLEKYNTYSEKTGESFRKIQLFKNFRSRQEIVNSVNFIFKQIMSVDVGELDYNDNEALNHGANFEECTDPDSITGGAAELHIIDTQTDETFETTSLEETETDEGNHETEEENPDSIQCEARIVARRIQNLLSADSNGKSFMVFDKNSKTYRKAEYKDIVILLRSTKNWSETFKEELGAQGIPVYADSGTGFFKTVEVQIILSLLQIIDNPNQDIPLLSVLRSPIAAFTQDELVDIRLADRNGTLFEGLKKLSEDKNAESSKKAADFLERLEKWRDRMNFMPTDELIWYLYSDTGFYGYAGAMPGGEQRQSNLRILFERARQFEETSYKGLFNFINFVNRLKSSKGDMGSAKILSENENVVRIMSIHKSKGLEFPIVILSGCGKLFNLRDMNKSILLHQDLGFGPDIVDYKKRISYSSTPKQALKKKIRMESLSEEMRILYVAFTRAKEKLIITGSVNNIDKALSKWSECASNKDAKLPKYEMLKARNFFDWIGPSLYRHKDCACLRERIGNKDSFSGLLLEDGSSWDIKTWNKSEILSSKVEAKNDEQEFLLWLDKIDLNKTYSDKFEEIGRRLNWEYPFKRASDIPVKFSVTELKRRFASEFSEETAAFSFNMPALIKKPAFLIESKGLSSAEAGTILHFVMQHLDFKQVSSVEEVSFQVGEMVFNELLTEQQADTVNVNKIYGFFKSNLGSRLISADKFYREVPFNIEISSREFYKDLEDAYNDETVLLQGVIDCYFEEEDNLVLLDYKTDYVPDGMSDSMRNKYKLQIEYYTKALEQLTGKRVKQRYIYLFWNGEVLEL